MPRCSAQILDPTRDKKNPVVCHKPATYVVTVATINAGSAKNVYRCATCVAGTMVIGRPGKLAIQ